MDWLGLFVLLATGLALAFASAVVYCAWFLTHPPRRGYAFAVAKGLAGTPAELAPSMGGGSKHREWVHRTGGAQMPVWEIDGGDPAGPVVIITHGWGESRIHSLLRVEPLAPLAARLILWDLRGHGEATGASRLGTTEVEDLVSLIAAVSDAPGGVVLYGSSLGAGVSIAAAAPEPRVIAVVAEAPYRMPLTPARRVMKQAGFPHRLNLPIAMTLIGLLNGQGWDWFRRRGPRAFDRRDHAAKLTAPLLVLHGSEDAICPLDDGQEIAAAAPSGRRQIIQGAGHLDLWTEERFRARCVQTIREFLDEVIKQGRQQSASAESSATRTRCT